MSSVILTLQVPKGSRGIPVATTADTDVLHLFRQVVIAEARRKLDLAEDEIERLLAQLELERLNKAFVVLIPEPDEFEPPEAREDGSL